MENQWNGKPMNNGNRIKRLLAVLGCSLALAGTALPASAGTLTLDPVGGGLSGSPGQTIGWGFTFVNETNFAVITGSSYITTTSVGAYTDFVSATFAVVGPAPESSTLTAAFDAAMSSGAGKIVVDPAAVPGALSTGILQVTYDVYSVSPNDPTFDPGIALISSGNTASAEASVSVIAATDMPGVPEPALLWPAAFIAAGLCLRRSRMRF